MNPLNIKEHLLTIYLAIPPILLTPSTLPVFASILIPLGIISLGIYLKKTYIGIIGIGLFYLITLQNLQITSMENITEIVLYLLLIIIPSLILLSYILQLSHPSHLIFLSNQKKPIISSIILGISIITGFYILALLIPNISILAPDTIEIQILIIAALSSIFCIPMIIKT
jgi:hypothetical protein